MESFDLFGIPRVPVLLHNFAAGVADRVTPGFQCETQKICRTRSDGHFLRVQPKIEFPKFGEKLVQEVEVSIDIAMHNKNVVDIYDYMPPYFGCEYFV